MSTIDPLGLRDVWFPERTFFLVLMGLLLGGVSFIILSNPPWWLTPLPPTPPQARQLQTSYNYSFDDQRTVRATRLAIDQPEAAVRAFYRTELTRRGWTYTHVWPGCWSRVNPPPFDFDTYDRRGRTLEVHMWGRDVDVLEWQRRVSYCNK